MTAPHLPSARHARRHVPRVPHREKQALTQSLRKSIASVGELYAHALAIEDEAVARYRDFAGRMSDLGNDAVAELFSRLAEFEVEHAVRLAKKTTRMTLPRLVPGEHAWLERNAPLPEARDFVYRMMTPRLALQLALRAEQRAKSFFEQVLAESADAGIRELAVELARDEDSHIAWVSDALVHAP